MYSGIFGSTIQGKVWFCSNSVYAYQESNSYNYPVSVISTSDFIVRFLGTPPRGIGGYNTLGSNNSDTYFRHFPTDNDLYFGSTYTYKPGSWSDSHNTQYIYLSSFPNVLMTINNLDSTVRKTADKTMKVTYTITKVDETQASS